MGRGRASPPPGRFHNASESHGAKVSFTGKLIRGKNTTYNCIFVAGSVFLMKLLLIEIKF